MIWQEKLDTALAEAKEMAKALPKYLDQDELFWQMIIHTPEGDKLPKMTIGGLLERVRHLERNREKLDGAAQESLRQIEESIDDARSRFREAYAKFLQKEFSSYLHSWHWYLDDLLSGNGDALDRYPQEVSIRERIELLIEEAGKVGAELPLEKVKAEDERLRRIWSEGDFIWPKELQKFYPKGRYWWLYGKPRPVEDD